MDTPPPCLPPMIGARNSALGLEGSPGSSHPARAEDWLFRGWGALSPGNRGCDPGGLDQFEASCGPPQATRYLGRRPSSALPWEPEGDSRGAIGGRDRQIHLGPRRSAKRPRLSPGASSCWRCRFRTSARIPSATLLCCL
nr:uncharacterized protein LOC105478440 [Macaca nemestrina]